MKVLYVAHFSERSGYSQAATNYVKALIAANVDVVCRDFRLNSSSGQFDDPLIAELSKKNTSNITHIIQHVLPHHMSYVDGVRNIGIFVYDLSSPDYCEWTRYLECMDEIWVPNKEAIRFFNRDNVLWVPHACDTSIYNAKYTKLDIPEIGGTCVFYTIADLNKRKNLIDTIIAFHTTFHSNEPVNLIIKTSKFGLSPEECSRALCGNLDIVKNELKLYPNITDYKPEIIISHRISEEQIHSLHYTGDCYINSSRGEAWNIPQFDAWAHGNHVIFYTSRDMYSYYQYSKKSYTLVHPVVCDTTPVFGYTDTFSGIGTGREEWLSSNISGLSNSMRAYYELWLNDANKLKHNEYEFFSYENVGKLMASYL